MQIKIAPDDSQSMAQSGDAILKSLQNSNFSTIDIIVRESIQNALDAAVKGRPVTRVDYQLGKFDAQRLNSEFDNISDELNRRFPKEAEFLSVRDSETVGLTGDYRSDDTRILNKSNFQKLVFSIGKNQEADGAGGSWGLGKTSYFRLGVGIVLYYTRVKDGDGYEERLIGSLIEDPKDKRKLLKKSNRGIAWWGTYEGKAPAKENAKIFPITDHQRIAEILEIFNIPGYQDDQTGTTIIVPYLHKYAHSSDSLPWERDRERAIQTAVQRWYSPRLVNEVYAKQSGNSQLVCTINGSNPIGLYGELEKPFKLMQALYNAAVTGSSDDAKITVKSIKISRMGMESPKVEAGKIAFTVQNKDELSNGDFTPLKYIEGTSDEVEAKASIVAFTRKPGMIVKYDVNGAWSSGVKVGDNQVLMGFFVPNSKGKLYKKFQTDRHKNLEQYLRASEKADHADWFDVDGLTLVNRITRLTAKALSDETEGTDDGGTTLLSSTLARRFGRLLPPENFGKAGKAPSNKKHKKTSPHKRTADIKIKDSSMLPNGNIQIHFEASLKGQALIELRIKTQDSSLKLSQWQGTFGELAFPISISDVTIEDGIVELMDSDQSSITLQNNQEAVATVEGAISLQLTSNEYQPQITIQQINN